MSTNNGHEKIDQTKKFVVSTYYNGSEATYSFGPFGTEKIANEFVKRLEDGKYTNIVVTIVNAPRLFGTGLEVS